MKLLSARLVKSLFRILTRIVSIHPGKFAKKNVNFVCHFQLGTHLHDSH